MWRKKLRRSCNVRVKHRHNEGRSGPVLEAGTFLGIRPIIKGNGVFLDEDSIVYACGNVLVRYSIRKKKGTVMISIDQEANFISTFIFTHQLQYLLTGMTRWAPYVNLFERVKRPDKPMYVKINTISCMVQRAEVFQVDFSCDRRYIAVLIGYLTKPMHVLLLHVGLSCPIARIKFRRKLYAQFKIMIHGVCFNPKFDNLFCMFGQGLFRTLHFIRWKDKFGEIHFKWKFLGFRHPGQTNFTKGHWHTPTIFFAFAADYRLFIIENGFLRGIYNVNNMHTILIPLNVIRNIRDEAINWRRIGASDLGVPWRLKEEFAIRDVISFKKGFAFAIRGNVFYWKSSWRDPRVYHKQRRFTLFREDVPFWVILPEEHVVVQNMHISPSGRFLSLASLSRQIFLFEARRDPGRTPHELPAVNFHDTSGIDSISSAEWKPWLLTLSHKRLLVWDYEQVKIVARFKLKFDGNCASIHPFGTYLAVATVTRTKVWRLQSTYTTNQLYARRWFGFRIEFVYCAYSDTGTHLGCCTRDGQVFVFHSVSYNILHIFSPAARMMTVKLHEFTGTMVTTGWKGITLKACLLCGGKIFEDKNCMVRLIGSPALMAGQHRCSDAVDIPECNTCFIVGDDGCITRLSYDDEGGNLRRMRIYPKRQASLNCIAWMNDCNALFVGGFKGSLLSIYRTTLRHLGLPGHRRRVCIRENFVHYSRIVQIHVLVTNRIITGSADGSLCFFKLSQSTARPYARRNLRLGCCFGFRLAEDWSDKMYAQIPAWHRWWFYEWLPPQYFLKQEIVMFKNIIAFLKEYPAYDRYLQDFIFDLKFDKDLKRWWCWEAIIKSFLTIIYSLRYNYNVKQLKRRREHGFVEWKRSGAFYQTLSLAPTVLLDILQCELMRFIDYCELGYIIIIAMWDLNFQWFAQTLSKAEERYYSGVRCGEKRYPLHWMWGIEYAAYALSQWGLHTLYRYDASDWLFFYVKATFMFQVLRDIQDYDTLKDDWEFKYLIVLFLKGKFKQYDDCKPLEIVYKYMGDTIEVCNDIWLDDAVYYLAFLRGNVKKYTQLERMTRDLTFQLARDKEMAELQNYHDHLNTHSFHTRMFYHNFRGRVISLMLHGILAQGILQQFLNSSRQGKVKQRDLLESEARRYLVDIYFTLDESSKLMLLILIWMLRMSLRRTADRSKDFVQKQSDAIWWEIYLYNKQFNIDRVLIERLPSNCQIGDIIVKSYRGCRRDVTSFIEKQLKDYRQPRYHRAPSHNSGAREELQTDQPWLLTNCWLDYIKVLFLLNGIRRRDLNHEAERFVDIHNRLNERVDDRYHANKSHYLIVDDERQDYIDVDPVMEKVYGTPPTHTPPLSASTGSIKHSKHTLCQIQNRVLTKLKPKVELPSKETDWYSILRVDPLAIKQRVRTRKVKYLMDLVRQINHKRVKYARHRVLWKYLRRALKVLPQYNLHMENSPHLILR